MTARVLIADDEPEISGMIRDALAERLGIAADVISNGALVMAAVQSQRPDVLLLDVDLPGLNGVDVFEMLSWEPGSPTRILFVTGRHDLAGHAPGGAEVITKPFDLDVLVARVAELCGAEAPA